MRRPSRSRRCSTPGWPSAPAPRTVTVPAWRSRSKDSDERRRAGAARLPRGATIGGCRRAGRRPRCVGALEPRFTRDLDFAVAVASDEEAAQYVLRMRQLGYEIVTALEQTARGRLSTIRLRRGGRGPIVDLLFAACGIEVEIAQAAEPMEIVAGVTANVAQVGHLIAMKLVSRDPKRRPRDQQDF